ncbi:MAG TPA: aldose 1-epimerase [Bryobacteraceae bacterium]|nr:aldose 1-epimerase [Bryobacteraceae bacterium]
MTAGKISTAALIAIFCSLPAAAQYSAKQDGDVVHLEDGKHHTVVSIITSVGNVAYEMKVNGTNVLYFPAVTPEAYKQRPALAGIPFLAPWANRLDEPAFYANGKKYVFNEGLGNVRGAIPIHGFLSSTDQWKVVEARADKNQAWVTSRLEFYRHPDWMAQFPFAHTIEMTYRLKDGVLEVHTKIENLSTDPMPIAIGFHPYYHLTDTPREEWNFSIAARTHWILAPNKIPTGETKPIETFFPDPKNVPLKDYSLDHVFGDLIRDTKGGAAIAMWDKKQRIDLTFGPKFQAAVLYSPNPTPAAIPPERGGPEPNPNASAPQGRGRGAGRGGPTPDPNFLAIEPMAGITDAMNLAQKGLYREQQMLAPGAVWEESFWVKPSGF